MRKTVFIASMLLSTLTWGVNLTGTVQTDASAPIVGAVVSDGYTVVTTDASGNYSMPYNGSAKFVFVSVPSGYDIPTDETGFAKIWQAIDKAQSTHTHNFTLHQQEDGGKADSAHVLITFGDPQVLNKYDMWRFKSETVADVKAFTASYPAGTKFIGLTVGDIVWDKYGYFSDQKAIYETLPFPNFLVIGNHDHNTNAPKQPTQAQQDSVAGLLYENIFGPTYYSFNVGAVHYVALDNVYYRGYNGGDKGYDCALTEKEKNWLRQDIAHVKKGTQVVYAMHINADNNPEDMKFMRDLVDSLGCTNYIISGHVHTNTIMTITDHFIQHNIGACQGSFWSCDWCGDGSPNGYKVFETDRTGFVNWFYKGTGWDEDFRITTYPTQSINAGNSKPNSVLANVWDYVSGESVQISENGGALTNMTKFTVDGKDPDVFDIMKAEGDSRPNYPGQAGGTIKDKNPGASTTKHIFSYRPRITNSSMEVVYTNRFGQVFRAPILKHMMVASFSKDSNDQWQYTQDFNHLPSYPNYIPNERRGTWVAGHTPKGWYAANSGSAMPGSGSETWKGYEWLHIDNGGQNMAWIKSFGSVSNLSEQNGTERSLGALNYNTQKRISYGVIIENNTGSRISALDVAYIGEVWRVGNDNTAKESLKVSYAILTDNEAINIRDRKMWIGEVTTTELPQLTFTTPNTLTAKTAGQTNTAIDGNNADNQARVSGRIDMTFDPGQVVLIRWDDDLATSNVDQALAIDDVKIAPSQATGLNEDVSLLNKYSKETRIVLIDGQVMIQTEQNTYTITGQKK